MRFLDNLPTLADVEAMRRGKPIPKGPSRLERQVIEEKRSVVDEKAFLAAVRTRDKLHCRMCKRKVVVQLARAAKRAECHHLYGRRGAFRYDDRFAICTCATCHERLTGKVNEKYIPVGTAFLEVDGKHLIDARAPMTFARIA